jgi:DNA-binding NarL/FixJ family response regulator
MENAGVEPSTYRTRVLVVEDDAFTRALTGESLVAVGMAVETAANVAGALEILRVYEPHVVVADLDLGGGPTGADLLTHVHEELPWVGLVALTSHASPTLAVGAGTVLPEGVVYLVKSRLSSIADLQAAIEAAISSTSLLPAEPLDADGPLIELSRAQGEILHLMAEGYSNAGIAEKRGTSMRAAESLVQRTLQAMGIEADSQMNSRVRAVRLWQSGRVVIR